jgi:hypothetical protein
MNIKRCWEDLRNSGLPMSYWQVWRLIRLHCQWQKFGGQVVVQKGDWQYFKAKLLSGWRPPRRHRGAEV